MTWEWLLGGLDFLVGAVFILSIISLIYALGQWIKGRWL
jgi:hypothetical protein